MSDRLHFLVIEDHLGDFILIKEYLQEEHHTIVLSRASSFREAKIKLKAPISYDAVLLDLSLPDSLDSESLVGEIVRLALNTPVIVLTGNTNKDFGVRTLSMGISDYLFKDELTASGLSKSVFYSIERKKAQIKLSESEKKYKSLFNLSPLPMWVLDRKELRFLNVNDAAVEMYGYSQEEFSAMTIRDIWNNKEEPDIEEIISKNKDNYFKVRVNHTKKNGELIFLEVQSNPIIFDGKEARLSLVNNITAQLEAEQALRHSEQRFKALVQDTSDLVAIMDFKGNYSYVSPAAQSALGISPDTLSEENFFNIIHPDNVDMVKECMEQLNYERRIQIPSYRIKYQMNTWRWIETIITNLCDDPAVNGIVANSRDITDFVLQERKLRESLQRYDIVAKATSDTITDYDVLNERMEYNEGIQNMFGYDLSQVSRDGDWWDEKIHPEDKERVKQRTEEVYSNRENQLQLEYRFRCADGTYKYILDRSYLVKDETGKPIRMIGSMQDVTAARSYIQTIERNNARLKDIAWTQSHVVRAPLARIMGLIDLLQNSDDLDERDLLLCNILSSAKELDTIIRKINNKTEASEKPKIS